ncbi:MAG: hypothetical protein K1X57_05705 [Gemmataceae bacterium]|nr:hypothetical protein [Gemmataceae bacterium]
MSATKIRRPRIALYSHDTMGIGHMRRNMLIAQELAATPVAANVLLIAGASEASAFTRTDRVDLLSLPSLRKTAAGKYEARAIDLELSELIEVRRQTIASAIGAFSPDILIVDKEPLGACRELDLTLHQVRDRGRTRCVLGLRDVLDDPAVVRREWETAGSENVIRDCFDEVWIYGDPAVYDLAEECAFSESIRQKVTFTGYLDGCARRSCRPAGDTVQDPAIQTPTEPFVLCTVGGGQDGVPLAEAFLESDIPAGRRGVIITGPCMPRDASRRIRQRTAGSDRWQFFEFHLDPCGLIRRAEKVVAMGGYNTVSELLGAGRPALIAPRTNPRREQWIRAERMAALGLLDFIPIDAITGNSISDWLSRPARPHADCRDRVNLNGLRMLPELVCRALHIDRKGVRENREVRHVAV